MGEVKLKKIGIATYHYADSYGAVLQCYALYNIINEFDNCKAEVINYIPETFILPQIWENQYNKQLFHIKRKKFQKFLKEYINLDDRKIDQITGENYDYCCVGSDQVWNMNFPISFEYFLPHIKNDLKLFSYAASIGIEPSHRDFDKEKIVKYISKFDSISVREEIHVQTIEELCKKKCECVLDPTLLLNVNYYKNLSSRVKKEHDPYILFFWLEGDNNLRWGAELANMIARKLNTRIIHSLNKNDYFIFNNEQENMAYAGIEEFLWYIQNAECIVTNSYHGTIFSIIFQKPFYTFNTILSRRCRIDTLTKKAGIEERIVNRNLFTDEIETKMDFEKINMNIQREKIKSLEYLKHTLDVV